MNIRKMGAPHHEPRTARALCQTMAWLRADGIPCALDPSDTAGLLVTKVDGGEIRIRFLAGEDPLESPVAASGHLTILAKELASTDAQIALKTFHTITQAAGWGTPIPVNRGADPTASLHYHDNFELISFRHCEFRRVPNPPPAELAQYDKVVAGACYRFFQKNIALCDRNGIELEDLETYAKIWTCNYLGLYKVAIETKNDNIRKLRVHLGQRFTELFCMITKKERNCLPTNEACQIAFFGTIVDRNHEIEGFSVDPRREEYVPRWHDDPPEYLTKYLARLPHDKLLDTLMGVITNSTHPPEARAEATARLRLHQEKCEVCAKSPHVLPPQARFEKGPKKTRRGKEISPEETLMVAEFWAGQPDMLHCGYRNGENHPDGLAPKSEFRYLADGRFEDGTPKKIKKCTYCISCFRIYSKDLAQKKKVTSEQS